MKHEVPDILVERLRLGELSPAEAARVRRRLAAAGELARLEIPEEAGFERLPEALVARLDRARRLARAHQRGAWRAWSLAVTAASFAVMAMVLAMPGPLPHEVSESRAKGGASQTSAQGSAALAVYRRIPGGHEALADGALARPGDVLQLGYRPGSARAVAIYSIDGRGLVTTHLAPTAAPPQGQAETRLPTAFALDDAPGYERFVLLLGDTIDETAAMARMQALAHRPDARTAPIDGPWRAISTRLDKGPR